MLCSAQEPKKFSDTRVCIAINGNAEQQSVKLCTTFITGISEQVGNHRKFIIARFFTIQNLYYYLRNQSVCLFVCQFVQNILFVPLFVSSSAILFRRNLFWNCMVSNFSIVCLKPLPCKISLVQVNYIYLMHNMSTLFVCLCICQSTFYVCTAVCLSVCMFVCLPGRKGHRRCPNRRVYTYFINELIRGNFY